MPGLGLSPRWGAAARAPAIAPLSPTQLSTGGPSFWLSAALSTLTGGSTVTAATDAAGGTGTMTGSMPFVAAAGGVPSYFDHKPKVAGSKLTGSALFGGVTPTGPTHWTVFVNCCYVEAPSAGTSTADALAVIGPEGPGPASNCVLGTSTAGTFQATAETDGPAISGVFGGPVLTSGTAGSTLPVYVCLAMVHFLCTGDGKWHIALYADGVMLTEQIAGSAGAGITLTSDAFSVGPGYSAWLGPHCHVFDAVWYAYALTAPQLQSLTAWASPAVGAPVVATHIVAAGASWTQGFAYSPTTHGWVGILAATILDAYPSHPVNVTNAAETSTYSGQWASGQPGLVAEGQIGYNSAVYPAATTAFGGALNARAKKRVGIVGGDLYTNDYGLASMTPTMSLIHAQELAARLLALGCDTVVMCGVQPYNNTVVSAGYVTAQVATNALLHAATWPAGVILFDWFATSDTTPIVSSAPVASTVGAALALITGATFDGTGIHALGTSNQATICAQAMTAWLNSKGLI